MKLNHPIVAILMTIAGFLQGVSVQAQRQATAIPTVVNGFVVAVIVTDGGTGYTNSPSVKILGGGGSGATAIATVVKGSVDKVIIEDAGKGYTGNPTVAIDSPPVPKLPFSDGLVAYYPFNGNANDESGNGRNGTLVNATLTTDRLGIANSAYSFNGKDSYIWIGTQVRPSLLSASGWFQTDVKTNIFGNQIIFRDRFNGWSIVIASNAYQNNSGFIYSDLHRLDGTYFRLWATNSAYNDGRWHMVNLTYDGYTASLYVDGVLAHSETKGIYSTINYQGGGLAIGRDGDFSGSFFQGVIDNVRIYNRVLSEKEVQDLYDYESLALPWVSINVKNIQVMMHVRPTKKYQLEASLDFKTWTNIGNVFTAITSELIQEFNAIEVGRFFRLSEVQ